MNMTSIRKHLGQWLIALGLWLLIVLLYSTRTTPPPNFKGSWPDMLKFTAGDWFIWVLFAPAIIHLDRRLPVARGALLQRLLYHIPLCLLVTSFATYGRWVIMFMLGFSGLIGSSPLPFDVLRESWNGFFHFYFLIYWAIVGVFVAFDHNNLLKEREIKTAELERLLSEAHLETLRNQMHPHFLFNALNTISAHVENNPRAARRMLEQLGELLRFSLDYAEDQEIPLSEEMIFIDRYLALQKARFEERLEVTVSVVPETLAAMVPTFILEHLVENAIRHGIAPRSQKGVMEIQTKKEKDRLHLSVRDNGPGLPPNWNVEKSAGIGISNMRERLRCLYGEENFTFNITNAEGGGVLAELLLPFHSADELFAGDPNHA
jgi:two-component system LytT family sensor kinase